ncbi:hypothetical protein HK105_208562 [Polyrhizophydium stewartii]|uniref:Uncharacterized protein n=1 Tax=Polyrhizophydium stewartii TaxID=2732419 RepID=A0ABR4MXB8_9FUNG
MLVRLLRKPKREPRKPTLIRNSNEPNAIKVVGDMVYNPVLQVWEGNEGVLSDFDKAMTTPQRPALIKNTPASKLPEQVGCMVFDPEKMCWIGNEEDADIFAEIDIDTTPANAQPPTIAFVFSKAAKEGLYISEASHKLFMGRWYPRVVQDSRMVMRDMSKTHLYDIRAILEAA